MGTRIRVWMAALAVAAAGCMVLALPAAPAAAVPQWGFEPDSAKVGETVRIVGTGWPTLGGDVSIFAPGVTASDENSIPIQIAEVDEDGGFIIEGVTVPAVAGGRQGFFACQSCPELNGPDAPANSDAILNVLPDFDIAEEGGLPRTVISVAGTGWLFGQGPVTLFASEADSSNPGSLIDSYDIQPDGKLVPDSSLEVPGYDPAMYNFFACQLCGLGAKTWGLEAPFEVKGAPPTTFDPVLDLDVVEAEIGQDVTATGQGWSDAAGEVFVYADASDAQDGRAPLAREPVDGGSFTTTITVPQTEAEVLSIYACQECSRSSDLTAEQSLGIVPVTVVVPRLSLSTDSGSPGTEFRATGTGWDGEVRLFASNDSVQQRPLGRAIATDGLFEADLLVPDIGLGSIRVLACQDCGTSDQRQDTASFTVVKAEQDGPSLTVEPQNVRSGERVVVSGAGWSPDDGVVTAFLKPAGSKNQRTVWFQVTPEAAGTLAEDVEVPDLEAADYVVVACQRCDDAPGFPRATRNLVISGDRPNLLMVVLVAGFCLILLMAALLGVLLRRGAGPAPTDEADPLAPPEPPRVRPHAAAVFDVRLRNPPNGADVELPSLDVVAHPDPARLADDVKGTP